MKQALLFMHERNYMEIQNEGNLQPRKTNSFYNENVAAARILIHVEHAHEMNRMYMSTKLDNLQQYFNSFLK